MEQRKNIAAKLVKIMQKCAYVQKDAENKEQKYKYVSAAAVLEKINPALVEANMISIPEFWIESEREKATARGGIWQLVTVQCKLTIIDADSGESVTVVSLGTGADPGDKATAKAQTMALKYAWLTALNIETGDEPENDGRTDQQLFTQPGTPTVPPTPGLSPVLPDTPKVRAICQLWQGLNWDTSLLPEYLEKRFGKPANQLTDQDLSVVENEANYYYQQRMR